jgi:hypothetical protein
MWLKFNFWYVAAQQAVPRLILTAAFECSHPHLQFHEWDHRY